MRKQQLIFNGKNLGANFESDPILMDDTTLFSINMFFQGASPKGTIKLMVSNDIEDDPRKVGWWQDLFNSDIPVAAARSDLNYWYIDFSFKWVKLVWTKDVGSVGTFTAQRFSPFVVR